MDGDALRAAGWSTLDLKGFSRISGPVWSRFEHGRRETGLLVEPQHTNDHLGTIHGGVIMTFADISLGCTVVDVLGAANCATVQLNSHFVAAAKLGEFVTCTPEVIRSTRQLIFLRALMSVGERTIASVDGMWKIFEARASRGASAAHPA